MLPITMPVPEASSLTMPPQASMILEWPQVRLPQAWCPPWAAAATKHWFSMARAASSVAQWARPVISVKVAGNTMRSGWERPRKSSGKRRSKPSERPTEKDSPSQVVILKVTGDLPGSM